MLEFTTNSVETVAARFAVGRDNKHETVVSIDDSWVIKSN